MRLLKLKKLFLIVFLFVFLQTSLFSTKAFCFGNETHRNITDLVFNKTEMARRFGIEYGVARKTILDASVAPDKIEQGWFYRGHFCEPLSSSTLEDDNAKYWMKFHFDKAVDCFSRDRVESLKELVMALHYTQDMCCPVHVNGWFGLENINFWRGFVYTTDGELVPKTTHTEYEDKMDRKSARFMTEVFMESEIPDFSAVETVGLDAVLNSSSLAAFCSRGDGELEPKLEVFKNAYRTCYEVVYLFFKAVGIDIST